MTDTTKDPVSVLRADLEAIDRAMQHMGDQLNEMDGVEEADEDIATPGFEAIARLLATTPAAIQHSEQRETVPAGEAIYQVATDKGFAWCDVDKEVFDAYADRSYQRRAVYLAAPVAAPVPEAKAEQAGNTYCLSCRGEGAVRSGIDEASESLCNACNGTGHEFTPAAPAVKHEASELPPLPEPSWRRFGANGADAYAVDQMHAYVLADRARSNAAWAEYLREGETPLGRLKREIRDSDSMATLLADARRQLAPPIAVQGSIGDGAVLDTLLDNYANDPTAENRAAIIAYIDSRSPVAAAPAGYGDVLEGGA